MRNHEIKNRVYGSLYGVAAGDALGAPLEFMSAEAIKKQHGFVTEMIGGGWLGVLPGEVTDDTEMTLAVAEGIVSNQFNPTEAIGVNFIKWLSSVPKDVGATCSASIRAAMKLAKKGQRSYPFYMDWTKAAELAHEQLNRRSAGNGSLMRAAYVGLYYQSRPDIFINSVFISGMTHYDRIAGETCAAYAIGIEALVTNPKKDSLHEALAEYGGFIPYYDREKLSDPRFKPTPSGYVVDSFEAALHCIYTTDSFEAAVAKAVNLGGDADTIGAITGGLAGALYGLSSIPTRWLSFLHKNAGDTIDRINRVAEIASRRRGVA